MIQDGDYDRNLDTKKILYLSADWYKQDCIDAPSKLYTRESYALKSQNRGPDTPIYMESL